MTSALADLKQRMAQLADISHIVSLAQWDQQTMMPPHGAEARAEALGTMSRIRHELFIDDETGRLLDGAAAELGDDDPDGDDARLVTLVRRQWEKGRRVSADLEAQMARAASVGQDAWVLARRDSDFAAFAPHLQHNIDLARRYIECQSDGSYARAYDVLLDDFEPEMSSAQVSELFNALKAEIVPMIATLVAAGPGPGDSPVEAEFPVPQQRLLVSEVLALMGFTPEAWRMDDTVHPFASGIGAGDVRITTRWDPRYFPMGLYGAMHECGHGLYEAGIPDRLRRTPIGATESLGLHESQSRLWENMVGRSRAFCEVLAPRIAALAGGELSKLDADSLYQAVNRVRPSFIRVEADEATYALHIILRFELEQALIDGTISVAQLPEVWNERFHEYIGLEVTDNANGVLQDVHWSAGLIGYFPTYALGNLIAGQLWERAHAELADLDGLIAAGELGPLREWLGQRVHRHGSKFPTAELLARELGGPISVIPFTNYLKAKLGDVYGIDLRSRDVDDIDSERTYQES
jgi:carboxypeptidase Taq